MKEKVSENEIEKEKLLILSKANSINSQSKYNKEQEVAPKDSGSAYLICLIFGIAAVFPFNVIVASTDIF